MKKDIDTLIAEERAEIISKYDKVSECTDRHFREICVIRNIGPKT